jgi:hypothetical protein
MITFKKYFAGLIHFLVLAIMLLFNGCSEIDWRTRFTEQLALFGHRNWIIIADSAYPLQSASGITTIPTDKSHLEVLKIVLHEIDKAPHVKPVILLDAELKMVTDADAPGIANYRAELQKLLEGKQTNVLPHEQIIAKLDQTARLFNVLILKTNMILPYTSVFLELDCAYWNSEKEKKLRDMIEEEK